MWPISVLRVFVSVFFTLFYVSALGIFIIAFDCDVSGGTAAAYNRKFPERKCLTTATLPTGVVGLALSLTFAVIAYHMEQAESDQHPLFTDPMGQPSSAVGVRNMLGKTAISFLWVVLIDLSKTLLALIMFGITAFLLLDIIRNLPYYYQVTNYIKGGAPGALPSPSPPPRPRPAGAAGTVSFFILHPTPHHLAIFDGFYHRALFMYAYFFLKRPRG